MKKGTIIKVPILILFSLLYGQDTLTIMNYNVLRFDGNTTVRAKHIKTIVDYVKPDLIILQEIDHKNGIDLLLSNVFNVNDSSFAAGPLPSTQWMKNGIIYNRTKFDLTSHKFISTVLRDIPGYTLSIKNAHSNVLPLTIFSAHLKASDSLDDSDQRWIEAKELYKYISQMDSSYHYILGGDFNVYGSDEPAYKLLVDSMTVDLEDPIGHWVRNENSHVEKFTQSTRSEQLSDGGASGGLDDRFDFILFSDHFTSKDPDMKYLDGSYKVIGNDGNHFNKSIVDGANSSVPDSIAEALYLASDHYPVIAKVVFTTKSTTSPVAHAGGDFVASIGDTILLNGSKSYDPNGSIVSYNWSQFSGPSVVIENSESIIAKFIVPEINRTSNFVFQLKVTDNEGESSTDYVNVKIEIKGGYTPYDIQFSRERGSGEDCYPSEFEGQNVEVTGIVTAVRPDKDYPNFFFQDPDKRKWAGIFIYINEGYNSPDVGDMITLKGDIAEYYGMTEMKNISSTTILSSDNAIEPVQLEAKLVSGSCSEWAEPYEGMLVRLINLVVSKTSDKDGRWIASDITGSVIVDNYLFVGDWPQPELGTHYKSITGIVHYTYGEYKIMPRNNNDFNAPYAAVKNPPEDFEMIINYPNPFNPSTIIEFNVKETDFISLDIIDIHGRKIAKLINGKPKTNKLIWNGRNDLGMTVPAGIYFARLETKYKIMTKKMIFLK